jgi:hypothetical protein
MSQQVSSRHEGDAGGTLLPFGETKKRKVTISVANSVAHLAGAQHTAWMLTNLLCRSHGVVEEVGIICPPGVPLVGRVVPFASPGVDLLTALIEGGKEIEVVPITTSGAGDYTISIGLQPEAGAAFATYGNGWCGGISTSPMEADAFGTISALPYGPYVAACIAAGEIFKSSRLRPEHYSLPGSVFYSLWNYCVSDMPLPDGPVTIAISTDALLAGVGAVGCAFLHALWGTPGLRGSLAMADNDEAGLESTNLNRYVLFGRRSVGKKKATMAAGILSGTGIAFDGYDVSIDAVDRIPPRVVSAVDKNSARHSIQLKYPARIFSASTYNLRAELLRCGPPGAGACLACYNPEETVMSDEDVRQKLLQGPDEMLEDFAKQHDVTAAEIRKSLQRPLCGSLGERAVAMLRPSSEPAAFAVGFVSVMAGTMLAAEFVKDHLSTSGVLCDEKQRAVFQFLNPLASSNRATHYARDPACPRCNPYGVGCRIWSRRHEAARGF